MRKVTFLMILSLTSALSIPVHFPHARANAQSGDSSGPQSLSYTITPVIRPRDHAPDGGRFFSSETAYIAGSHALNNNGDVVVCSAVGSQCFFGTYLISSAEKITLADYCTPSVLGPFATINNANVNDQGQAAIGGWTRKDPASPMVASVLLSSAGNLTKVAAIGDLPPDPTVFKAGFAAVYGGEPFGPAINNQGDVAFYAGGQDATGQTVGGIFVYSTTGIRKLIQTGDACPTGGTFDVAASLSESLHLNDKGVVLFTSSASGSSYGFFLAGPDGVTKIIQPPDLLPGGDLFFAMAGNADLNNNNQVVFPAPLFSRPDSLGLFLYTNGQISKLVATGDPTPIGGQFNFSGSTTTDIQRPRINNVGDIAFSAPITGAASGRAIFVLSGNNIVKVVAIGDRLPTGEKIKELGEFSFNDRGQVSFRALGKNRPLGIYLATPSSSS